MGDSIVTGLSEAFKHGLEVFFGNSYSGIFDAENERSVSLDSSKDRNLSSGSCELAGVGEQIEQYLTHRPFICPDRRLTDDLYGQSDAAFLRFGQHKINATLGKQMEIYNLFTQRK